MQYQDEMEEEQPKQTNEEEQGSDSETDWSRLGQEPSTSSGNTRRRGRGGVRKRYPILLVF